MKLNQLFTDDDAVSPVIGVILMVAITVILAAVIGAFVLGFGPGDNSAPSVTWDVEEDSSAGGNGTVTFTHEGGEDINGDDLTAGQNVAVFDSGNSGVLTIGDSFTVEVESGLDPGDEVTVGTSGSEGSQVVASHTLSANW